MYKIERQLTSSETWVGFTREYKCLDDAIAALEIKERRYPFDKHRIIKFEVVNVTPQDLEHMEKLNASP